MGRVGAWAPSPRDLSRRSRTVDVMAARSSLDLLIEIHQSERNAQLSHFDSLDTKAGLVLGFAGVLIGLGNQSWLGLPSVLLAVLAAGMVGGASLARWFP